MTLTFGTSGLRAEATAFDAGSVAAYVTAFLLHIGTKPGDEVFVGCDLRASSPEISARVVAAIAANGQVPHWCGILPTPALAAAAMARRAPAIEITGSHIPETYNGIKFYRPDGELLKKDEAPILAFADKALAAGKVPDAVLLPDADPMPASAYVARYVACFEPGVLKGAKLGVYEHSAAGRDLLAAILSELGAELVRFGRSDTFIAVDTEALETKVLAACTEEIANNGLDAVVSTDGDGDRPLLIAHDGQQINGDVLCTLAARALGIRTVVTPLTSTGAIELSGWFDEIVRTRVGSPYVVDAMQCSGAASLAGFEANGGFLLGSGLDLAGGVLAPLPTRDAVLPLVAILVEARNRRVTLTDLVADLPLRVMKADRLKQIPHTVSGPFLEKIATSADLRARLAAALEKPMEIDQTDGVRFTLADGSIMHFRASGNAPELRLYVETGSSAETTRRLEKTMVRLANVLADGSR